IFRVDAALREAARDEPKARLRSSREHVTQFSSIAESPNRADAGGNIIPEQFADQMLLPLVACRQHDQVGGKHLAATHERACRHEGGDIGELRQSDLAFDDQIRTADIEVVAAAGEVLELPPGSVFAEIELEAAALEPIEQFLSIFRAVSVNAMWLFRTSESGMDVVMRSQSSSEGPSSSSAYCSSALGSTLTIMVELRCTSVTFAPAECRSCAISWPLLPDPITRTFLPLHASPSSYWLEFRTLPPTFPH